MGSYEVNPSTHRVMGGAYNDEIAGPCSKYSGTMRIAGTTFTQDEAKEIRGRFNLSESQFHLDMDANQEGTYCITYENPAMNKLFVENFECSDLDQSWLDQALDRIPFVDPPRCELIRDDVALIAGIYKPGVIESVTEFVKKAPGHLAEMTIAGIGFAGGAYILEKVVKKITGVSFLGQVINLLKNGGTPKGPGGPQSPGETPSSKAPDSPPPPVEQAPPAPAPEGATPSKFVSRLPSDWLPNMKNSVPPRPVWQYPLIGLISGLIIFSLAAEEAAALAGKVRTLSFVAPGADIPGYLSGQGYDSGYSGYGPGA